MRSPGGWHPVRSRAHELFGFAGIVVLSLVFAGAALAQSVTAVPVKANASVARDHSGEGGARWGRSATRFDPAAYRPMPLPRSIERARGAAPTPAGQRVSLDLAARREMRDSASADAPGQGTASDAGTGTLVNREPPGSAAPENFDGLSVVASTTSGRYPTHCKLFMKFRDTAGNLYGYVGSGTLIDASHVLTAGHCVFAHDDTDNGRVFNDWAEEILVVPGYDNGEVVYGDAYAVSLHSWTGWTVDENFDHDIGVIDLDRPIGALTGWRPFSYTTNCDFFKTGTWEHNGYPKEDPYNGQQMFHQTGTFDSCEEESGTWSGYEVRFDRKSYGGESGSGAVKLDIVWGVLSNGNDTHTDDVRLTSGKCNDVESWIDEDLPSGFDLVPLHVSISPATVAPGDALSSFAFDVINYSSASYSGTLYFDVYLSTNDNISTSDVPIARYAVAVSLAAKGSTHLTASLPPTIPASTASGNYYVGVILDVVDDGPANNETDGQDAAPITVQCGSPAFPALSSPETGADCLDTSVTLDWADVSNAVRYEVQYGSACGVGDITVTSASSYTASALVTNATYYWRVRAQNQCGNYSPWCVCRHFSTAPGPAAPPTLVAPIGGTCRPTDIELQWDASANSVSYDVQIGTSCGAGVVNATLATSFTASGLDAGTLYYWRVRGENSCGSKGSWSPCRSFTTAPAVPDVPGFVGPADGAVVPSGAVLDWTNVAGAASYEIEIGACGAGASHACAASSYATTGFADGAYSWRVRALSTCGDAGSWSACRTFTLDTRPPLLPVKLWSSSHLAGVWSSSSTVHVDWSPSSDLNEVAGYSIVWDHGPSTTPDATVDVADSASASPALGDGSDFWCHVRPVDVAGNASDSTRHLGPFWIDATLPVATLRSPNGGESWTPGSTHAIEWSATDATSGVRSVEIRYSRDAGATFTEIVASPAPGETSYVWTVPADTTSRAKLQVVVTDRAGNVRTEASNLFQIGSVALGVNDGAPAPAFALEPNAPNPFARATSIRYALAKAASVQLVILDASGRRVRTLVDGEQAANRYGVTWDGRDDRGNAVGDGVFFCRLRAGEFQQTRRMVRVR